jgi:hypothetical protein
VTVRAYETLLEQHTEDYQIEGVDWSRLGLHGPGRHDITTTLAGVFDVEGDPENPDAGLVLVTGDRTAMEIVVEDATNVTLRLDLDDDGDFDDVPEIMTTWAALEF